jgi:hypothetical protein
MGAHSWSGYAQAIYIFLPAKSPHNNKCTHLKKFYYALEWRVSLGEVLLYNIIIFNVYVFVPSTNEQISLNEILLPVLFASLLKKVLCDSLRVSGTFTIITIAIPVTPLSIAFCRNQRTDRDTVWRRDVYGKHQNSRPVRRSWWPLSHATWTEQIRCSDSIYTFRII